MNLTWILLADTFFAGFKEASLRVLNSMERHSGEGAEGGPPSIVSKVPRPLIQQLSKKLKPDNHRAQ